jgi:MFS family permease
MTQPPAGITGPSRLSTPAWTLVLASLGLFMVALDNMVVTLALPALRASLHASLADLEWTVNAYLLSFAAGC